MREFSLPSNIEAEEGVISCILAYPNSIGRVQDILTRDDFCRDDYAQIFEVALSLYQRGKTPNMQNIQYELKRLGKVEEAGGEYALDVISTSLKSLDPITDHAEALKAISINRRLAMLGYRMFQEACKNQADLEQIEQEFYSIVMGASTNTVSTLDEVMGNFLQELDVRRENFKNKVANGVPTGFVDLDRILGGLQPSELIILAARPSVGKTALSLNIALNIVQHSKHALFFSLEMTKSALAQRLVAMETPMDQTMLRDGDVNDEEMGKVIMAADSLAGCDLRIDDRSRTLSDIKSVARRMHSIKPLDVIMIDYLGLIKSSEQGRERNKNRAEEVSEIARQLQELAKDLNVPVFALAQLNRGIESRQIKRPVLSDLKESGGIEENAHVVMFLGCSEEELEKRFRCEPYRIDIYVEKQRQGPVGEVSLLFRPRSTKFSNMEVPA